MLNDYTNQMNEPMETSPGQELTKVFVIRVDREDGTSYFPTLIYKSGPDWKQELNDASGYFEKDGEVSVSLASSLLDAGVNNPESTVEWKVYRENLFNAESKDPTEKHLAYMSKKGLSAKLIDEVDRDLRVSDNEEMLLAHTNLLSGSEEKEGIKKALEIAKDSHAGQSQKRPQDKEGLEHIPYVNHPVQVANLAFRLQLSPEAIQAALLHDVIEDTDMEMEDLKAKGFSEKVLSMLTDLTKKPSESRQEYLDRVAKLKGESKLLKCIDRYQNILRAFSIEDTSYIDRYIRESKDIYLPAFLELEELRELAVPFNNLIEELEKYGKTLD